VSYLDEDQAGWCAGSEGQALQGVRGTLEPQRPGRVSVGADPHEAGVTRLVPWFRIELNRSAVGKNGVSGGC
jgi:hypothetical protein